MPRNVLLLRLDAARAHREEVVVTGDADHTAHAEGQEAVFSTAAEVLDVLALGADMTGALRADAAARVRQRLLPEVDADDPWADDDPADAVGERAHYLSGVRDGLDELPEVLAGLHRWTYDEVADA